MKACETCGSMIPSAAPACPGCGAAATTTAAYSPWSSTAPATAQWHVGGPTAGRGRDLRRTASGVTAVVTLVAAILALGWFSFGPADPFAPNAGSKRPYIDAMVASSRINPAQRTVPAQTTRCVAAAIVHGYGVSAFARAGLTPKGLRRPNSTLRALAAPTARQIEEIGTAEQLCGVGQVVAEQFVRDLHIADANAVRCLTPVFAKNANARGFVVFAMLDRRPDLMAAHSVVMVATKCVDTVRLVFGASGLRATPAEELCIIAAVKSSDEMIDHRLAQSMTGATPTRRQFQVLFAPGIEHCVSSDRRAQLSGS